MAWLVARGLDRLGHAVRVYGHLDRDPFSFGERGQWFDRRDFLDLECDVLIMSRYPASVDAQVKARARILWVHDVHCGTDMTPARAQRMDRIWCLTGWHRSYFMAAYPWVQPDKVVVIRNAIDPDVWARPEGVVRNMHRAVYSSSPDRGLPLALELWPRVREQVPDAELHVYYGWDNWLKVAELTGDEAMAKTARELLDRAKSTEGVVVHGRVNERELAREFWSSGVWAYPTWWLETSCITAMQAQAAGLRIVTSAIAGLNETVQIGVLLPEEYGSQDYRKRWVHEVVCAMSAKDPRSHVYHCGTARGFFVEPLVQDLDKQMRDLVSAPVVPAFSEDGL
jgi:glycosyltransferase involved in cell wall biosynthesis